MEGPTGGMLMWEAGQGNHDSILDTQYSILGALWQLPLPLLVQQSSLGSQVTQAAARYLDHTSRILREKVVAPDEVRNISRKIPEVIISLEDSCAMAAYHV